MQAFRTKGWALGLAGCLCAMLTAANCGKGGRTETQPKSPTHYQDYKGVVEKIPSYTFPLKGSWETTIEYTFPNVRWWLLTDTIVRGTLAPDPKNPLPPMKLGVTERVFATAEEYYETLEEASAFIPAKYVRRETPVLKFNVKMPGQVTITLDGQDMQLMVYKEYSGRFSAELNDKEGHKEKTFRAEVGLYTLKIKLMSSFNTRYHLVVKWVPDTPPPTPTPEVTPVDESNVEELVEAYGEEAPAEEATPTEESTETQENSGQTETEPAPEENSGDQQAPPEDEGEPQEY